MPTLAEDNAIRVVCFDDQPDVTTVLRLLIDGEPDMRCVGTFDSADDLVRIVHDLERGPGGPLVVVLDGVMPGTDSFLAMQELARVAPHVKTIVYSGRTERCVIDDSIDAGACGYISKSAAPDHLLRGVRDVAHGYTCFPSSF